MFNMNKKPNAKGKFSPIEMTVSDGLCTRCNQPVIPGKTGTILYKDDFGIDGVVLCYNCVYKELGVGAT